MTKQRVYNQASLERMIPGTKATKDPTECRRCKKHEPEVELVLPRMCRLCNSERAKEARAKKKLAGNLKKGD